MKIKKVITEICEACLDGVGEECHTPGCALFLHPVGSGVCIHAYDVLDEWDAEEIHRGEKT